MAQQHVVQRDRDGIVSWLTPERRRALYGVVAAVLSLGTAIGWVTQEQATTWQQVVEQLLGVVALLLAVAHTGGSYTGPVTLPDQTHTAPREG